MIVASCCAGALSAGEAGPLAEAHLVLRVNDPAWVERTINQLGGAREAAGRDLRAWFARALYRSRSFDALDPARPAVFAWRAGRAPLLAILPVRDRLVFLDDFGAGPDGEPPLVRVGDNDGTAVLRQNRLGRDGLVEYRLLVTNGFAHLAPTVAECRALAATGVRGVDDAGVLTLSGTGAALAHLVRALPAGGDLAALMPQVRHWSIRVQAAGEAVVRLQGVLTAVPESALARWIAAQRNQAGRLAPQVRAGGETALLSLSLSWLGQAERWLLEQTPALRGRFGAAWTPAVDESWRLLAGLVERTGSAAAALSGDGLTLACEHPRAGEALALIAGLGDVIAGLPHLDLVVGGRPALLRAGEVSVAGERHLVSVTGPKADERAAALLGRLERPLPPEGAPAIADLWFDAAGFEVVPDGGEPVARPGRVAVRVAGAERLELEAEVPLAVVLPLAERFDLLPAPVAPTPRR